MAIPALSPESVLEELGFTNLLKTEEKKAKFNLDAIEQKIFEILSYEPYHIDEIARNLDIDITDIMVKLLNMEFNGAVRQLPGKHYIRSI
jgi:DNA processing protein